MVIFRSMQLLKRSTQRHQFVVKLGGRQYRRNRSMFKSTNSQLLTRNSTSMNNLQPIFSTLKQYQAPLQNRVQILLNRCSAKLNIRMKTRSCRVINKRLAFQDYHWLLFARSSMAEQCIKTVTFSLFLKCSNNENEFISSH